MKTEEKKIEEKDNKINSNNNNNNKTKISKTVKTEKTEKTEKTNKTKNKNKKKVGIINIIIILLIIIFIGIYILNIIVPKNDMLKFYRKIGIISEKQKEELVKQEAKEFIEEYLKKREETLHKLDIKELEKKANVRDNFYAELKPKELVLNINEKLKEKEDFKNEKVSLDSSYEPFIFKIQYGNEKYRVHEYMINNGKLERKDIDEEKLGNSPIIWIKENVLVTPKGEIILKADSKGKPIFDAKKIVEAYDKEDKKITSKIRSRI